MYADTATFMPVIILFIDYHSGQTPEISWILIVLQSSTVTSVDRL
jgi:hypothetical protein